MDARALIVLAVTSVYLALCVAIGVWPTRKSSHSAAGFVAGDRGLGLLLMYFITGATIFSAFTFLGMPGWAATRGAASFYILSYGVLGFVPFYFVGVRAARLGRRFGFVTQGEMVGARFGSRTLSVLIALVSLVAFVPYLALQIQGAGVVLSTVSGGALSARWAGALVYAVVALYVCTSGVLGVGWTNVFQGVFMLALAWGLGLWLPAELYGGVREMFERIAAERPELLRAPGLSASGAPWSWSEYSSAVVVSMIGFSFWPHLFMKAFTARDDRTLRRTVVLYPTFLLFQIPILLLGFAGALFEPPAPQPDHTLPHLLMSIDLPAVVVGLFCAGGLAASMSSGDAIAHAAASIAVRDGLVAGMGLEFAPERERTWIRVLVVAVMIGSFVLAGWFGSSIVFLLLFAYGPVTQLAPVVLAALYWRRATAWGAVAGLAAGISVNLTFALHADWRPWPVHAGLYGLAANVLALAAVSLFTRPRFAASDEYLRVGATP